MKTNLMWIEQEWKRWTENENTALGIPIRKVLDVDSKEHVAKLFAAFCLDRLRMEAQVLDSYDSSGVEARIVKHLTENNG